MEIRERLCHWQCQYSMSVSFTYQFPSKTQVECWFYLGFLYCDFWNIYINIHLTFLLLLCDCFIGKLCKGIGMYVYGRTHHVQRILRFSLPQSDSWKGADNQVLILKWCVAWAYGCVRGWLNADRLENLLVSRTELLEFDGPCGPINVQLKKKKDIIIKPLFCGGLLQQM